ncbi:MAG: serine/threonine-protein kinase [Sandaracinaceae bacterium]
MEPDAAGDGSADRPSHFGGGVQPGHVIAGRYVVMRELGAGGMGQVVEVEHIELEKRFALKLIRPDRWDASLEARFRREAKALARVVTPRVAQVTDFGVDGDRGPFYVMELVDGEPLDELIRRQGALPKHRAIEIAIGIAEALDDIHGASIVHRDVKPGNVGICARGPVEVRLLDFGLATSVDDRFGSRITESKKIVGSMPYMAPEQFHGAAPSPAMDLWALGVVLYEMLTAQLPFEAQSSAALMHKILTDPPPVDRLAPPLAALLSTLLAKEPGDRPASAEDMVVALESALSAPDLAADEPTLNIPSFATAEAQRVDTDSPLTATRSRSVPLIAGVSLAVAGAAAAIAAVLYASQPSDGGAVEPPVPPAPMAVTESLGSAPTETAVPTLEEPMEGVREVERARSERPSEVAEAAPVDPPRLVRRGARARVESEASPVEREPTTQTAPAPIPDAWSGQIIEAPR